ncbi:hypothetical protein [Thermophilibacter mediterraneus]|uniref:hypothetical protein n=1 Tax=Thermophilibacter mediterraneus TaxID=1871031 RepID=UPI002354EDE5|nr:hypothetical protein [Thermophilibacter mediterraneus]
MRKNERLARRAELALDAARHRARLALGLFALAALGYAAAEVALEYVVGSLAGVDAQALGVISLVVTGVLLAVLVVCEVRAWRAVVGACREAPSGADGFILGASLWFGGAAPLAVVNSVRHLMGVAVAGDATSTYLQVAVAAAFGVFAVLRYLPELRG